MSNRRATWFAAFQIIFLVGAIGFQIAINGTNHRQDTEIQHGQQRALYAIRESQYRGCVLNGNVLRDQVRREFVDIKRKVLIPTFGGIAATIPEGSEARAILEGQVAYLKQRIKTIKERLPDVNCKRIYPPLPGQTYPHIVARARHGEGGHPRADSPTRPPEMPQVGAPSSPSSPSFPEPSSSPPSPQGTTGPQGPQGPQGTPGPQGPSGGGQTNPPPTPPPTQPPLIQVDPSADCQVTALGIRVCL